ncbi:transposase [Streptomyces sp. NPDC049097]|uniref:IS110 family transposase n=1 Tax=Streptomyces sp. NPDC049097 TaxID=3155497 RepID=UPI00343FF63A
MARNSRKRCRRHSAGQAVHVPGRTVKHTAGAYRGKAKTYARDAYVMVETSHHRRDFTTIDVLVHPAADLASLTAHRTHLVTDRVRMTNRRHDALTGMFPAPGARLRLSGPQGRLVLLTGYQSPPAPRSRGQAR